MSRLDSVGIAKQSALGTKQTTMEFYPPVESAEVSHNREVIEQEETIGNRFPTGIDYGTEHFGVNFAGSGRAASLPRIISGFLGAPTTTTPDATNAPTGRQHAFDPAAAGKTPVPHSILVNRTDPSTAITDLLWDALGNELTLSVEPNGFIRYQASYLAIANDDARPEPTVTADFSKRFSFDQAKAYISVDGGAESEVKVANWSLNYSNNLDADLAVLGSRSLYSLVEGNATASVTFTPRESLSTHYRRALLADPASVKLRLTATGATIGGTVAYKVEVICNKLEYLTAPANLSAGDRLNMVEISARAAYDNSASKFVTLDVVNETASY